VPLMQIGAGDCEAIRAGFWGQPVSTLSALAFFAVGVWVVRLVPRSHGRRIEVGLFAATLFANGVGSLLYHGPRPEGALWLHDLAIATFLGLVVAVDAEALVGRRGPGLAAYAAVIAAAGLLLFAAPDAQRPLFTVLGVSAGALELVSWRRGLRPHPMEGPTPRVIAWLGGLVVLTLGGIAFFLGRNSSPFCDPSSLLQWHAVWHLLEAAAMATYVRVAVVPTPESWSGSTPRPAE